MFGKLVLIAALFTGQHAVSAEFTSLPVSASEMVVCRGEEKFISIRFTGWGPNWGWLGFANAEVKPQGNSCLMSAKENKLPGGALVSWTVEATNPGPSRLAFDAVLGCSKDTAITMMDVAVNVESETFSGGKAELKYADGTVKVHPYPWGKNLGAGEERGKKVAGLALVSAAGARTVFGFEPAVEVVSDNEIRIVVARNRLPAGSFRLAFSVDLPETTAFYRSPNEVPQEPGFEAWYPFQPANDHARPSAFGMEDWLEPPAGKHGRISMEGDKLVCNGKAIKLWGLNDTYRGCFPVKAMADRQAAYYAKYGINSVRFHKYADGPGWAGILSTNGVLEFDAMQLDRMDYFVAKLKEKGIYIELSSNFMLKIGPADRSRVPYYDELKDAMFKGWKIADIGSIFLGRELQDLQIEQLVNLLRHRNPYTGMTYAEDPAVACVEMYNEDDALWFGVIGQLKKPTLRKRAGVLFTAWLKRKYGTREALLQAWGDGALDSFVAEGLTGEKWEEDSILPIGNPWFFETEQLEGSQAFRRQRLLDTMAFLHELQNDFYARFQKTVREAGYPGPMIASNWQAGMGAAHYYNLHTDSLFGVIDRHNYFEGGWQVIENSSMLAQPGSGMLSSGLQQVDKRPFMLSEWIHVNLNEWTVEGPAIIGAYAMGLQGWDASFIFQNGDEGGIRSRFKDPFQVDKPTAIGIFPFVARQVLRGDVKESELVIPRYVDLPSLAQGKLGFVDKVVQQNDVKSFDNDKTPGKALAVGRCVAVFGDQPRETPSFDLTPYVTKGVVRAAGGQLEWHEGKTRQDGFITVNTPGTKAVVGFAKGQTCVLGDVVMKPESRYGAFYLTAAGKDQTLASDKRLLVLAMARVRQSGSKVFAGKYVLDIGREPFVLEPVKITITLARPGPATLIPLEHNGFRTARRIRLEQGTFTLDTAVEKTPYFEIVYGPVGDEFSPTPAVTPGR